MRGSTEATTCTTLIVWGPRATPLTANLRIGDEGWADGVGGPRRERYALFEKKIDTFPRQICERYAIQLNDQKYLFDHAYPFKIVSRHPDYFEYFLFYAPAKRNGIINFYINNLDVLESFASFFRASAIELIDKASRERVMPGAKTDRCHGWQAPERMRRIASPHELRDFLGILTRRQLQIAQHVVAGHTAGYIARELCLSPRTVETHIENMRHKLGCANGTELVVCFLQADMHPSSRPGQP